MTMTDHEIELEFTKVKDEILKVKQDHRKACSIVVVVNLVMGTLLIGICLHLYTRQDEEAQQIRDTQTSLVETETTIKKFGQELASEVESSDLPIKVPNLQQIRQGVQQQVQQQQQQNAVNN